MQYIICVKVTYSDGTQAASEGEFPRVAPRAEVMDWLQLGEVPAGASAVTVTAQAMRIGARDCCTPVGTLRIVEAPLPTRPAPPPAASEPQVVFDVTFATP